MQGRGLMGGGERAPATTVEKGRTVVPAEWHNGDATQTLSNPFIFHQTNSSESTLAFSAIQHLVNKIGLLYGTSKTYPRYKWVTRQKPTTIEKKLTRIHVLLPREENEGDTTVLLTSGGVIHDRNGEG